MAKVIFFIDKTNISRIFVCEHSFWLKAILLIAGNEKTA